jgi:hypothetical protein
MPCRPGYAQYPVYIGALLTAVQLAKLDARAKLQRLTRSDVLRALIEWPRSPRRRALTTPQQRSSSCPKLEP